MTKKNKTMCGSVASYNIHSEQRPDNKQTTPRKKKSEQKNPKKTVRQKMQLIFSSICLTMTNEKRKGKRMPICSPCTCECNKT